MKAHKDRVATWYCCCLNCDAGEEAIFGTPEIRNARERAKRHNEKTGHKVVLEINNSYVYDGKTE